MRVHEYSISQTTMEDVFIVFYVVFMCEFVFYVFNKCCHDYCVVVKNGRRRLNNGLASLQPGRDATHGGLIAQRRRHGVEQGRHSRSVLGVCTSFSVRQVSAPVNRRI